MKETIEARLAALAAEHDAGRKMLADLDERRANLTQTLLRIEGAMQVLREILGNNGAAVTTVTPPAPNPSSPSS